MPFGNARYGVSIQGFSNANPCVITVTPDPTKFLNLGDEVIVAACVSSPGIQLNGKYIITALSTTTITIDIDSSSFGTYVSGGFVTPEQVANTAPTIQVSAFKEFVPYVWTNLARGTGTSVFSADASNAEAEIIN